MFLKQKINENRVNEYNLSGLLYYVICIHQKRRGHWAVDYTNTQIFIKMYFIRWLNKLRT